MRHVTCQLLGQGRDKDLVHFRAELMAGGGTEDLEGVLAITLDGHGLCTSLREWWRSKRDQQPPVSGS